MEIGAPYWRIRGRRCHCDCGGEGVLVFITCPGCGYVAVACDEIGTVFASPRDLSLPPYGCWFAASGSRETCPGCGKVPLADYEYSTAEEIQSVGFSPTE